MLITKLSQMSGIEILVRSISISLGLLSVSTLSASAEITATTGVGSTGTTFATGATPNTIDIKDGQKSSDNKNLFHSFGKFNVDAGQVANFKPDAGIQNILGTVTDGASLINGKLQVNGGSTTTAVNLFLMNPAGIVFGKGASLDINGAFTATTAKAIDFNGKWFNALGTNNYNELTGNPLGLAFTGGTSGSIFNAATLSNVQPGKSITLVGGTVISTGDIKTAGGNISIATVEGGKYVEIKDGGILRLYLPASAPNINPEAKAFTAVLLPQLLTATGVNLEATGVKNEKGVVTLVGNPAANALVPDIDKALADKNKALADYKKAETDYKKAEADYKKARTAAGGNESLVDPTIVNAFEAAKIAENNSSREKGRSTTLVNDINNKIDTLSAVGEPSATLSGDTISKQNRSISSGDVITRDIGTSNFYKGGNIYIQSSQAILSGKINTNSRTENVPDQANQIYRSGNIVLDAQTELKTKAIDSSSVISNNGSIKRTTGGNVTLSTQTKDIIVNSISTVASKDENSYNPGTRLTKAQSTGFLGGNVTIKSAGLFRVITTDGISSSLFGVININHGSKKPFASGVTGESVSGQSDRIIIPGFTFPDGASGSRGAIVTSQGTNGSIGIIYKDQPIDGNTIAANNTLATSSAKKDPKDNSAGSPDDQASKPGDSEEGKQKGKCTKNSSAIASAKLGTDPTRSGNSANAAAEEFCPPNNSNSGILQILTDRN
jgi:filamentous hemagglutinin family protein